MCAQKAADFFQHNPADIVNQAVVLRHRDKLAGGDKRAVPAKEPDQGFRGGEAFLPAVVNRLVIHLKGLMLNGVPQLFQHVLLMLHGLLKRAVKEEHPRAAFAGEQGDCIVHLINQPVFSGVLRREQQMHQIGFCRDAASLLLGRNIPAFLETLLYPARERLRLFLGTRRADHHETGIGYPVRLVVLIQPPQVIRDAPDQRVADGNAVGPVHQKELAGLYQDDMGLQTLLPAAIDVPGKGQPVLQLCHGIKRRRNIFLHAFFLHHLSVCATNEGVRRLFCQGSGGAL